MADTILEAKRKASELGSDYKFDRIVVLWK